MQTWRVGRAAQSAVLSGRHSMFDAHVRDEDKEDTSRIITIGLPWNRGPGEWVGQGRGCATTMQQRANARGQPPLYPGYTGMPRRASSEKLERDT